MCEGDVGAMARLQAGSHKAGRWGVGGGQGRLPARWGGGAVAFEGTLRDGTEPSWQAREEPPGGGMAG